MPDENDPYQVLGVERGVSMAEARAAYLQRLSDPLRERLTTEEQLRLLSALNRIERALRAVGDPSARSAGEEMRSERAQRFRIVLALVALLPIVFGALALFGAAPHDEEILIFDGKEVDPDETCVLWDPEVWDGWDTESGDCSEIAEHRTVHRGWEGGLVGFGLTSMAFGIGLGSLALIKPKAGTAPHN